jgi:hypothetical protein
MFSWIPMAKAEKFIREGPTIGGPYTLWGPLYLHDYDLTIGVGRSVCPCMNPKGLGGIGRCFKNGCIVKIILGALRVGEGRTTTVDQKETGICIPSCDPR